MEPSRLLRHRVSWEFQSFRGESGGIQKSALQDASEIKKPIIGLHVNEFLITHEAPDYERKSARVSMRLVPKKR